MTRRFFLSAIMVVWFAVGDIAVAAQQPGAASELIQRLGEQAVAAARDPGTGLETRSERFRSLLGEAFDLPFISRFVLGRYWKQATPEQRSEYLALFSAYVLQTYSARLGGYTGETMAILSERPAGPRDVLVSTRIERPSGPPIEAGWLVRTSGESGRIIDVRVEGVSMLFSQRAEFAAVIQRQGLQGLIEGMRARAAKLSAAAPTD
jgi:phospholipid transport system substrate-binding protein